MIRFLVFISLFVGCAPVTPSPRNAEVAGVVFVTAERVSPRVMRLALDNGASQPIGYNLCLSELQRRSDSGWTAVPDTGVCTMQLLSLNPGHDATFEKRLPDGLAPGEYRFTTGIENPLGTGQVRIATDPFAL